MALPIAVAIDVPGVLGGLFIVLLAAKLGDELFTRLGQPPPVGEILAGVLIGPSVLGIVGPTETFEVFAELGVIFLLFWVGLETRISDLREVGTVATKVAVLGVVIPFGAAIALGLWLGEELPTAVFIGAALVATSVGITSAALLETKALDSRAGRTILGAAVIDDVLAMLLLAVAVGLAAESGLDPGALLLTLGVALAFVAFFALGGTRIARERPQLLQAPRFSESPLLPAVLLCLGLAALSAQIGLAAIIGAFLAGMIVAETKEQHPIEREIEPLYAFFPPFFFAFIGTQVDLQALAEPSTLALLAAVTALAIATKFGGAWLGARSLGGRDAVVVGVGMVPRGEVGIIVAGIGASTGVIDATLFAVIVGMSVLTTVLVPPVLRRIAATGSTPPEAAAPSSPDR